MEAGGWVSGMAGAPQLSWWRLQSLLLLPESGEASAVKEITTGPGVAQGDFVSRFQAVGKLNHNIQDCKHF